MYYEREIMDDNRQPRLWAGSRVVEMDEGLYGQGWVTPEGAAPALMPTLTCMPSSAV